MVVATVNDSAILLSELRSVTLGTIRSLRASGRIVSPNDESLLLRRELKGLIDKRRLALSIHSMGIYTPEQIDGYVKSVLEQERLEKQRDVGSMLGLSQALKEEGRTWPTYEREQRLEKLSEFAEDATVREDAARDLRTREGGVRARGALARGDDRVHRTGRQGPRRRRRRVVGPAGDERPRDGRDLSGCPQPR
jgi:hypothetical protein